MNADTKERLSCLFDVVRVSVQYGYIPLILYLGLKKGSDAGGPELTIFSLLWQ